MYGERKNLLEPACNLCQVYEYYAEFLGYNVTFFHHIILHKSLDLFHEVIMQVNACVFSLYLIIIIADK